MTQPAPQDTMTTMMSSSTPTDDNNQISNGNIQSNIELFFIIFKISVGLIGMVGNAIVCNILVKIPPGKVKFLIGTQCIIDLLTSIILVAVTLNRVPSLTLPVPNNLFLGYLYCWLWRSETILFCLFSTSSYNLVAIAIERYMAVLHPMWYRIYFTKMKSILLGVIMWAIAPTMQLAWVITNRVYNGVECRVIIHPAIVTSTVGVLIFCWDFFIPCCIMGYCFSRICIALKEHDKQAKTLKGHTGQSSGTTNYEITSVSGKVDEKGSKGQHSEVRGHESSADDMKRSRRVTKTFVIVFLAYILCWSLNQILFLQYNLGGVLFYRTPLGYFANTLSLQNIICNPFIYVLSNKEYRKKLNCFSLRTR